MSELTQVGIDVTVRVDHQPIHQVRATMLSLKTMTTGRHVVVDMRARPEIAKLAAEFGAIYASHRHRGSQRTQNLCRSVDLDDVLVARCR